MIRGGRPENGPITYVLQGETNAKSDPSASCARLSGGDADRSEHHRELRRRRPANHKSSSCRTIPVATPTICRIRWPRRNARRAATALEAQLQGKIPADRTVAEVAKGQFVELAQEDDDLIFTILGEFSDTSFPNPLFAGGLPGPQHNEIPEPDRCGRQQLHLGARLQPGVTTRSCCSPTTPASNSMTTYYEEQSSGRYTVDGDITDWGQVPFDTAFYGRDYCGSIVCPTTWYFVQDTAAAWYQSQIDAGMTADQIDDYLSQVRRLGSLRPRRRR